MEIQDNDQHPAPRELTAEEVRDRFLEHMYALVRYWANETRVTSELDRCEGLMHSFLTMIDGCSGDMPAFHLIPDPHPDDEEYHRDEGENWYPSNDVSELKGLVTDGVMLHEMMIRFGKK